MKVIKICLVLFGMIIVPAVMYSLTRFLASILDIHVAYVLAFLVYIPALTIFIIYRIKVIRRRNRLWGGG